MKPTTQPKPKKITATPALLAAVKGTGRDKAGRRTGPRFVAAPDTPAKKRRRALDEREAMELRVLDA